MAFVHGGRLVAQALKRHGTTHLFTLCGGHIQAIYDGCLDEGIRVVDVRHEQTAGHAADGYARVTGRPGVCAVTAGPGVTDVVTAVANAQRAGIPMICIGGAGPKRSATWARSRTWTTSTLMRPITKWSVAGPRDAAHPRVHRRGVPRRAGERARAGVPRDAARPADEHATTTPTCRRRVRSTSRRARPAIRASIATRRRAAPQARKRPCFLVGTQVRWSPRARAPRAPSLERFGAPVYLNGMARGALPSRASAPLQPLASLRARRRPTSSSCSARRSTSASTTAARRRGTPTRRSSRSTSTAPSSGATAASTSRSTATRGIVLEQLAREVGARSSTSPSGSRAVRADEDKRRAKMQPRSSRTSRRPTRSASAPSSASGSSTNDIVIGDGGDFVATAAYVLKLEWPQLWMDPGPLGTLGVGPGYAMAAKLARPDAQRRARLRRRQLRPPRHRVRGDGAPEHPRHRRHRQRRRLDADPPRPGRDLRRASARSRRRSTTRATRRSSRPAAVAASGSRRSRSSAPRSTRRSPAGSRRAST